MSKVLSSAAKVAVLVVVVSYILMAQFDIQEVVPFALASLFFLALYASGWVLTSSGDRSRPRRDWSKVATPGLTVGSRPDAGLTSDQEARLDAMIDSAMADPAASRVSLGSGANPPTAAESDLITSRPTVPSPSLAAPDRRGSSGTQPGGSGADLKMQAAYDARWAATLAAMRPGELQRLEDPSLREALMDEVWLATALDQPVSRGPTATGSANGSSPPKNAAPHAGDVGAADGDLSPEQLAAFKTRLAVKVNALRPEQATAIHADPEAMQSLANEALLEALIDTGSPDQLVTVANTLAEQLEGPILTADEWAFITARGGKEFRDPDYRARFEYLLRTDPALLRDIKDSMAQIRAPER